MGIREAEKYILSIPKFTKKNPSEHTKEFMHRLGEPWTDMKVVHVAGTNGKGSVCSYLQALLLAEGKRIGLFTSPHLVRMNERIRINGIEVSDETFLAGFDRVMDAVRQMESEGIAHPTFFEFLFGMAMVIFRMEQVEYCILETGLGGRLDATNVVPKPELTVITSIGLDHMEYLGDTVEEIAEEKAGIIKPHVPLIFDGHEPESRKVLLKAAEKHKVWCREISENAYEILETGQKSIAFLMANAYYGSTVWEVGAPALYQVRNAVLALNSMEILMRGRTPGSIKAWQEAVRTMCWPGRMEEVSDGIFFDGAHNLPGIQAFAESAKKIRRRPEILLFSAVADKKHREMIDYLCRELEPDLAVITKISGSRGESLECLKKEFEVSTKRRVAVIEDLEEAYRFAVKERGETGILFCLGSLYLIGELEALLKEECKC